MQSKSLLIAVAAFAVTATGVYAHDGGLLAKAGLTDDQVTAVEEARELRKSGDFIAARDLLADAGIDEDALKAIKKVYKGSRSAVKDAVEAEDYEAFRLAIADSPLADIVTTETDFERFVEAHQLRKDGEQEEARELLEDLGVDVDHRHSHLGSQKSHAMNQFTDEQKEALFTARQANDGATIQAIFDEAGVERHGRGQR